ncbi:MAG: transposase [Chloroflexota bacterium]
MKHASYWIDEDRRAVIAAAITEVCEFRGWILRASHVRSNHVHVVVQVPERPERIIGDFKKIASRRLAEILGEPRDRPRWARHGSTRYLWSVESVETAVRYVVEAQGTRLDAYENTGNIDL